MFKYLKRKIFTMLIFLYVNLCVKYVHDVFSLYGIDLGMILAIRVLDHD